MFRNSRRYFSREIRRRRRLNKFASYQLLHSNVYNKQSFEPANSYWTGILTDDLFVRAGPEKGLLSLRGYLSRGESFFLFFKRARPGPAIVVARDERYARNYELNGGRCVLRDFREHDSKDSLFSPPPGGRRTMEYLAAVNSSRLTTVRRPFTRYTRGEATGNFSVVVSADRVER